MSILRSRMVYIQCDIRTIEHIWCKLSILKKEMSIGFEFLECFGEFHSCHRFVSGSIGIVSWFEKLYILQEIGESFQIIA